MIIYKKFNFINEIETLIFTFFFSFFYIKIFLNAIELTYIPEFLMCIFFFLKGKKNLISSRRINNGLKNISKKKKKYIYIYMCVCVCVCVRECV